MRLPSCIAVAVVGWVLFVDAPPAARAADEKLLLGFEDAEFDRIGKAITITRREGKTSAGTAFVAWENPGGFPSLGRWVVYSDRASEGKQSLGISVVGGYEQIVYARDKFVLPREAVRYYGILNNSYGSGNGARFNTCGVFRRVFPTDWSEYDLLRLDAYAAEVEQTIRVVLEDEEIGPPLSRDLVVPPGKWVTLEIDLRAAAKERGLDPRRMATLTIGVHELAAQLKAPRDHTARVDNLRLASRDAPAKLEVVRDPSPYALPDYYRATTPQPEKLPAGAPDRSPLALEKPFVIPTEKACRVAPVGFAAAYDNRRLLVGFNDGMTSAGTSNVLLQQSLDGGKTWRGLDGGEKPTAMYLFNPDHGSGRGDVVGTRADVLFFNNIGCAGPNIASLRLFSRKLTLTDDGWELREMPTLVDCDLRHCNSNQSIVRTQDGRLWAAYGFVGRLGTNSINVRYSDDDGLIWKSWAENKAGLLPGSLKPEANGIGFGYTFEEPCLVPFGKGIACIWQDRKGYEFTKLLWSRFDGEKWSAIEEFEEPKRTVFRPVTRPPLHAVSLRGEEVFVVGGLFDGVLHYKDGKWSVEAPDVPAGSRISAAGDKTIVVVAGASAGADKGPVVLRSWQRGAKGRWSEPVDLAREEKALSHSHDNIYIVRPGLVVQPYAPPNFVPIAWSSEGEKWIKYLRVPVVE